MDEMTVNRRAFGLSGIGFAISSESKKPQLFVANGKGLMINIITPREVPIQG